MGSWLRRNSPRTAKKTAASTLIQAEVGDEVVALAGRLDIPANKAGQWSMEFMRNAPRGTGSAAFLVLQYALDARDIVVPERSA